MMRRTPLSRGSKPLQRTELLRGSSSLRRSAVRAVSPKRKKDAPKRRELVRALLEQFPVCQVPWCAALSVDVHEPLTRARGGSILDPSNCRCVCRAHHDEIHTEPPWAYDLGFLRHSWDAA